MAWQPRVAERLAAREPNSYRADPAVPKFPDEHPLIVYDGVCVLCASTMSFIADRDRCGRFRYTNAQSALGQALFRHYGLDPETFETVLLIEDGRAYGKLDMIRRVAREIGGAARAINLLALLPGRVQDWCYDLVARNRYRLFGRSEACMLPDASWRQRVID